MSIELSKGMYVEEDMLVRAKDDVKLENRPVGLVKGRVYEVLEIDYETETLEVAIGNSVESFTWDEFEMYESQEGHSLREVKVPVVPEYVAHIYQMQNKKGGDIIYEMMLRQDYGMKDEFGDWLFSDSENIRKYMSMIDYGQYIVKEDDTYTLEYQSRLKNQYDKFSLEERTEFTAKELHDMGIISDVDTMTVLNDRFRVNRVG